MAQKSPMLDVFERNKYDLATSVRKSKGWFEQQVTLLTKQQLTPAKVLNGNTDDLVTRIMPGKLYMYGYDPKGKKVGGAPKKASAGDEFDKLFGSSSK